MSDNTGNNNSDLKWEASVDDKTGEFFDKFDKRISQTDALVASKAGGIGTSLAKIGPIIGIVGGFAGALASGLLKAVTGGVQGIGELISESIKLRTEIDSLDNSVEALGKTTGLTSEQITAQSEALKAGGLTTKSSLEGIHALLQNQLDVTKATDLLNIAQDASIIKGQKVSDTYQQLVSSTASMNEKNLLSMGIYVDFQAELEKTALATGRVIESIGEEERRQIALNAVIKAGSQILGTYEKNQDSLSRTVRALPGYYEEIKYALGEAFEPVYAAAISEWEIFLKNLIEWLDDNQEEIQDLGEDLANFVSGSGRLFLELLLEILKVIPKIVTAIPDLANEIGTVLGQAMGQTREEMDAAGSNMETFLKIVIIVGAAIRSMKETLNGAIADINTGIKAFDKFLDFVGKTGVMAPLFSGAGFADALGKDPQGFLEKFMTSYKTAFDELKEQFGLVDDSAKNAAGGLDDLTDSMTEQERAALKLNNALATANYKLTELQKSVEEERITAQIKDQRDAIILAINTARQREDIERNHADRIRTILENASEARAELAQQLADTQVEIEEDHRKRLEQLLREFNFEASELARKRDAVGLLELMRRNKKQVEDEERDAEERRLQARKNFDKTLRQMDENLQKQLRKAEEARVKEYESLNRNLARQAELKALYDQWEEEDRQRKLDKTLKDMFENFRALDGMTQSGLNKLLQDWGAYYTTLINIINTQNAAIAAAGGGGVPYTILPYQTPTNTGTPDDQLTDQEYRDKYGHDRWRVTTTNTGQAGQVSYLLADQLDASRIQRVPQVAPNKSSTSKDIRVTVDGSGLDPYIQRVVARTLMEIERNS